MRVHFHTDEPEEGARKLPWSNRAMQKRLRANKEAHHQNTKCSFSDGQIFTHTEEILSAYHPATKLSIPPWLLYHSPMLCLMKLWKNS